MARNVWTVEEQLDRRRLCVHGDDPPAASQQLDGVASRTTAEIDCEPGGFPSASKAASACSNVSRGASPAAA